MKCSKCGTEDNFEEVLLSVPVRWDPLRGVIKSPVYFYKCRNCGRYCDPKK